MCLSEDAVSKLIKIQEKFKYERDYVLEKAIELFYEELCKEDSIQQLKVEVAYLTEKMEGFQGDISKISKCCQSLQMRVSELENKYDR